jgi:CTP synthase (UTP-ammonia lyase)
MTQPIRVALIGDYNPSVPAHLAVPRALELAGADLALKVAHRWIHTTELGDQNMFEKLNSFQGIWCVPASPYANGEGALAAISLARQKRIPFLGTCGGFQHALIEYFRNVLAMPAEHAEENPQAKFQVISRLSCALVEVTGRVRLKAGSLAHELYGVPEVEEAFHCNYGFNQDFWGLLAGARDLVVSGKGGDDGEMRIIELQDHPFFLATLFQPERSAFAGIVHPLIRGFVSAAATEPVYNPCQTEDSPA